MSRDHFAKTMNSPYFQGEHYRNSKARNLEKKIESFFKKIKKNKNEDPENIKKFKYLRRQDCLTFKEFDNKYNLDTAHLIITAKDGSNEKAPGIEDNSEIYPGSNGYQVCSLAHMDLICEMIQDIPEIEFYSFIDMGSGKGKMLFYNILKKRKFLNYIGIEIDKDLYDTSIKNLNTTNIVLDKDIKFINESILNYNIEEKPQVMFFFRPMEQHLYEQFIIQNKNILSKNKIIIIEFCPYEYKEHPLSIIGFSLYKRSDQCIDIYVSDKVFNS